MPRSVSRYGWRPDLPDHRDLLLTPRPTAQRPSAVDLRPLMPEVYDQGDVGSCTGNSTAALMRYMRRREKLDPDFAPSRLFIYWNGRSYEGDTDQDAGAQIRDVIKGVVQFGAPPEEEWPYDVAQVTAKPPEDAYTAGTLDLAVKYQRIIQDTTSLRNCLALGLAFVFGFAVYESFESDEVARTGVMPMPGPGEGILGGHAVMAVGYDDEQQRFIVRNSWGAEWGMGGYFTMPYAYLINRGLASDFWTIQRTTGG